MPEMRISRSATPRLLLRTVKKGAKVKIIGVIYDKHPNAAYFWKDSGIKVPKDLAGKTIAVPATDGHKVMWPAFAKQVGIDPNSVTFVNIEPAAKIAAVPDMILALSDELAALRLWATAEGLPSDVAEGIAISITKIELALEKTRT